MSSVGKWLWGVSVAFFFLFQCATWQTSPGYQLLNDQQYDAALKLFTQELRESYQNGREPSLEILNGAAVAQYQLKNFKESIKYCRSVLARKPNHGSALYFLGASLEALNRHSMALACYSKYPYVGNDEPYYGMLKAKANILKERRQKIKRAANR